MIEHDWGTGTPVRDVTIENNRFLNSCAVRQYNTPILISVLPRKDSFVRDGIHQNITITGNLIDGAPYAGLMLTDASGVTLADNIFRRTNLQKQPAEAAVSESLFLDATIVLEGVSNLRMSGNQILERGPGADRDIKQNP